MTLKLFKAMWFLSVAAVLTSLLYVYASLPEQVVIQEKSSGLVLANREFLFYVLMAFIVIVNVLVYIISKLYGPFENFRAWFHGLIVTMNLFFIIAMSLLQVYNSAERFDFSRISFLIYGSVALVILWAVSWPVYSIFRKFSSKPTVS